MTFLKGSEDKTSSALMLFHITLNFLLKKYFFILVIYEQIAK